ncbi:MAG: nicotinamide-nucleotide adenylyltransferase, partial [Desulfurococcaceae archaeon]
MRGLFIGRFQPFHRGHLHSLQYIAREVDEIVIVIAAAQYSYTLENPFTAGERVEMVRLGAIGLHDRLFIIPVDNIPSNHAWPRHVLSYVPRVDVVYSNNELVQLLFKEYGLPVKSTPILPGVNGSLVRRLMAENDNWRNLVPQTVADFIEKINGVERVKLLWRIQARLPGERL